MAPGGFYENRSDHMAYDQSMASGNPNTGNQPRAESPTGLLPLNAFGGHTPEVGDVCKFRVVQIYDDQVEVEYVKHDGEDDESTEQPGLPDESSEGEMSQYLQ